MEAEEFKRTRVYVLGGRGYGKTTVINCLLNQTNIPSDCGDISVYTGRLCSDISKEDRRVADLQLDMWEVPGGRVLRALYPILLTEPGIYLVLVTADTHNPEVEAIDICRNILYKIHKPHIIVILTKTNSASCKNLNIGNLCRRVRDKWNEVVSQCCQGDTHVNSIPLNPEDKRDEELNPAVTESKWSLLVHPFNSKDSQVLEQLKQSILKCASGICSDAGYDLSIKPTILRTLQFIQKKRKERIFFVTKEQFPESNSYLTGKTLTYLLKKDYVREFRSVPNNTSASVMCVDPLAFSNLVLRSHLDAGGHVFRLEAGKFWPSNMDRKPPNPEVLAGVLENLQSSGMIAESFLPLLWNTPYIREDQMYLTLGVMECLGLVCHAHPFGQAVDPSPVLDMPFFSYLSNVSTRHVMLMNKLTEVKPVLHWTDNPHKGDFQITVHFCCPSGMPVGVVLRILALCVNMTKPFTQYNHIWRQGVLIQLGHEVKIHVHAFTNELDFTARVVSDSYSDLKTATQVLWMTVAPCLVSVVELFSSFPGLATETYLSFRGDPNFDEVFRRSSTDRRMTIDQLVCKQLLQQSVSVSSKWLIPFKVDSSVTSFETWLAFLMTNRKDVLQILAPDLLFPPDSRSLPGYVSTENVPRKTTRKTSNVSWDIKNKLTESESNNTATRVHEANTETAPSKTDTVTMHPVKLASEANSAHLSPLRDQAASSHQGAQPEFDEKIAFKVASSLSAAVLSASVAKFMEEENTVRRTWSPAQVLAVREISRLSSSVWEGDMTKVSSAISNAVAKNQRSLDVKFSNSHSPAIHSTRFCVLL